MKRTVSPPVKGVIKIAFFKLVRQISSCELRGGKRHAFLPFDTILRFDLVTSSSRVFSHIDRLLRTPEMESDF